jgi:hypothetical protein
VLIACVIAQYKHEMVLAFKARDVEPRKTTSQTPTPRLNPEHSLQGVRGAYGTARMHMSIATTEVMVEDV